MQSLAIQQLSAVPSEGMVDLLHNHYKYKLIYDLKNLTNYTEQLLNKNYQHLKEKLVSVENKLINHFISPWLYCHFFKLCDLMDAENVPEVLRIFSILQNTAEQKYSFAKQKIQLGLFEEWERQVFQEEFVASYGTDTLLPTSATNAELDLFRDYVGGTLEFIGEAEPIYLQEIRSLVSTILLVNSMSNMEGGTSPRFFGAVYLSFPKQNLSDHPLVFLADSLVHEMSHLFLNAIMAYDPLVLNELNSQYLSPVRAELRPMIGIYHAVFVLSRVIRLFNNVSGSLVKNQSRSPGTPYAKPPVNHSVGYSTYTITDSHGSYSYHCEYQTPSTALSNDLMTKQLVLKGTCTSKKLSN